MIEQIKEYKQVNGMFLKIYPFFLENSLHFPTFRVIDRIQNLKGDFYYDLYYW